MDAEDKLYGEILNMKLLLRDVAYEFKCYSANDIKKLIASKRSKALKQLYELEEAIGNLRSSFSVALATEKALAKEAKAKEKARSQASATEAKEATEDQGSVSRNHSA